jgi:hypothetical protein
MHPAPLLLLCLTLLTFIINKVLVCCCLFYLVFGHLYICCCLPAAACLWGVCSLPPQPLRFAAAPLALVASILALLLGRWLITICSSLQDENMCGSKQR